LKPQDLIPVKLNEAKKYCYNKKPSGRTVFAVFAVVFFTICDTIILQVVVICGAVLKAGDDINLLGADFFAIAAFYAVRRP